MAVYYQPICRPKYLSTAETLPVAGGWMCFDHCVRLERGCPPEQVPLNDVPDPWKEALSSKRTSIAGISMDVPRLMGILNVTPDSFSDGGKYAVSEDALKHAALMVGVGADILDIGGESTRPGAAFVPAEEEISRTASIISALDVEMDTPISIDTRKAIVAEAALGAGAQILNDVSAFTYDEDMIEIAARSNAPICLMHAQGGPKTMQADPRYDNVLLDVYDFLAERIATSQAAGISRDRIIVDPGIGFGKTVHHNLALLQGLSLFHGLGCVVLLGASRKRFIGEIGQEPVAENRVGGSISVTLQGISQGVQISRVHDIEATRQAMSLQQAIGGASYA